ncbi:alpha-xenorhabdolysin family binary toxin subunit A [Pseudomonas sp. R1-6]|uniref:alpha-xenorhabdolysin family binary toxin subunit A n=1 Tax=Pseudomonas sp. R1-6 TaxID=2817397 RepID=UPI003DA8CEAE
MEIELDDRIVKAAAEAPEVFVKASFGEGGGNNRQPGIQLTKEQIISLKKYEVLGLSLPVRLQDVEVYLNYGAGDVGGPGLKAVDFQRTFAITYDHAKRWSPLRERIMQTGNQLSNFSDTFTKYGKRIIAVYEYLDASDYLKKHKIKTVEEYFELMRTLPDLPDLTVEKGDIEEIQGFLKEMLFEVQKNHKNAEGVRLELDKFGIDMRETVLPAVKLRLKAVSDNTYKQDIEVIQKEIDQRAASIDELNQQYADMVKEAIRAAATLNIGGLIMGIYQGVKAEELRKERNRLKNEQDGDIQKLSSKSQTLASLNRVRGDLQNLSAVTIEAEAATRNLMLVWNSLSNFIESSSEHVEKIENAVRLRMFITQIELVVSPWENEIQHRSDALLAIFDEAEKEYQAGNLIKPRMARMSYMSNESYYPQLNVSALLGSNEGMQSSRTQAQLLLEFHNYLPDVVATMTGLASVANVETAELRKRAQTTIFNLEQTAKKLETYKAKMDRFDEEDKEDFRSEIEFEVDKLNKLISLEAKELGGIQLSLSTHYDRSASKEWVLVLEQDRAYAEEQKANAQAKRIELDEQAKSVSEAIETIRKNGVEKFGQEAQLTVENLAAMGMAPPQVQVALLAMDTLKKLVAGIGETISYLSMVAGYNTLKERVRQLRIDIDVQDKDIAVIRGKIELVKSLDSLDGFRLDYVKEFANIAGAYERFAKVFAREESPSIEEDIQKVLSTVPGVIQYLRPLSGQWLI